MQKISLAIHGGAGTILKQDMTAAFEKKYRQGLQLAINTGYAILEKGGTATDAVIAATIALEDDILTIGEKEDIKRLKLWLAIKEDDFHFYGQSYIPQIVNYQLFRIYHDNLITNEEALFKTDLQEIFNLSFDQMND